MLLAHCTEKMIEYQTKIDPRQLLESRRRLQRRLGHLFNPVDASIKKARRKWKYVRRGNDRAVD